MTHPSRYSRVGNPGNKGGPGAKSKFTDDTVAKLLDAVRNGNPVTNACHLAGINGQTLKNWLAKADDPDPACDDYREFADLLELANAEAQSQRLERITQAGRDGDWKADLEILERRWPQHWSKVKHVVHEHANANQPKTVGELRAILRQSLELLEGLEDGAPVPMQLTEGNETT